MSIFVLTNQLITINVYCMKKVKEISLSRLLKLETRILVEKVVEILQKYDLEALRLQDFNTILLDQWTKVQVLVDPPGPHAYTQDIGRLHKKRLNYATLIVMQVESLGKIDAEEKKRQVKLAKRLTKSYLTNLGRENVGSVTSHILSFFEALANENRSEEREAFVNLGLQHYLDELQQINTQYEDLCALRRKDRYERPPIDSKNVEREAQRVLRLFFEQINSFQQTFKDIDYQPLIKELNVRLTKHSKNIKARIATNKRRVRKKAEAAKALADLEKNKADEVMIDGTNEAPSDIKPEEENPEDNKVQNLNMGKKKKNRGKRKS